MSLRSRVPPLVRAFVRYVARTGDPGVVPVVLLKGEVEAEVDGFADRIFADVEGALERAAAAGDVDLPGGSARFDYDTRLLLPAMLALGRVHILADDVPLTRRWRSVDRDLLAAGRETTFEIVRALLDGDMRDAINDEEFEDFETNVRPRDRVAEIAQRRLQENVEGWLAREETPEDVGRHYRHAVEVSERHQDEDTDYRELLDRLRSGGDDRAAAAEAVVSTYKFAGLDGGASLFEAERDLPYFATQYERVGIIYEDMLNMYEADLGSPLGEDFKRSIVLMVIAAQIGLDDTDDYPEDRGEQLTPVTAELQMNGADGVGVIREVVLTYLDRASAYSHDHLSGMAIAYIREQALDRIDGLAHVHGHGHG